MDEFDKYFILRHYALPTVKRQIAELHGETGDALLPELRIAKKLIEEWMKELEREACE